MLQLSAETRNAVFNSRIEFVTLAVIVVPLIINSSLKLRNKRIRNAPPKSLLPLNKSYSQGMINKIIVQVMFHTGHY